MGWRGRHVVVTGGSSGIGEAVALAAAQRGASVTLMARSEARLAEATARLLTAVPGAEVGVVPADVSDGEVVADAFARAVGERGHVDVLVCSAGVSRPGRFVELDDDVFRSMIDIDFFGTLWPIRSVVPEMVRRRRGSVVGICSAAGLVGVYGYSAYGAAKFAVRGLLESLRTELAPHGVHVGCVYPPDVDTPMLADEEEFKPVETRAIAGTIKPLSAERVASSVIRGIDRRQPEIFADPATRILARSVAAVPGVYRRLFDRRVREST